MTIKICFLALFKSWLLQRLNKCYLLGNFVNIIIIFDWCLVAVENTTDAASLHIQSCLNLCAHRHTHAHTHTYIWEVLSRWEKNNVMSATMSKWGLLCMLSICGDSVPFIDNLWLPTIQQHEYSTKCMRVPPTEKRWKWRTQRFMD